MKAVINTALLVLLLGAIVGPIGLILETFAEVRRDHIAAATVSCRAGYVSIWSPDSRFGDKRLTCVQGYVP